jgi:Na+/H+ antiporter NhaC
VSKTSKNQLTLSYVWSILSAEAFGGAMENTGLLVRLVKPTIEWVQGDRRLTVATGLTSISVNVVASDQCMVIHGALI